MVDKRKAHNHPIRRQFNRWKRWNWHLFGTLSLNLLFWLVVFWLYDLSRYGFQMLPHGLMFLLFGVFTGIPLAAHYVHVRLSGNEDQARIPALYSRWKRWSLHTFGTLQFLFVMLVVLMVIPGWQLQNIRWQYPLDSMLIGTVLLTLIAVAAHYVHVRIANAEDRAIAGVHPDSHYDEWDSRSERLAMPAQEVNDDEAGYLPPRKDKRKRQTHS
jgi:hypothetical protein